MQCIFRKENADKALKYRLYRHLPAYEKIIRNLVSFYNKNDYVIGNKSKKEVPFPQEEVTVTVPA